MEPQNQAEQLHKARKSHFTLEHSAWPQAKHCQLGSIPSGLSVAGMYHKCALFEFKSGFFSVIAK